MRGSLFSCTCSNIFQDDSYGEGQRVHVLGPSGWSCTTCGRLKPLHPHQVRVARVDGAAYPPANLDPGHHRG